jgi:hypothetical protein
MCRASRWNNRRVLLRWLKQLRRLVVEGRYAAMARALDVAIEQLENLVKQ